tara:strand:- start:10824 stop:11708 length:885 start_codon:yes stop_codon:yes gene_type:complete
MKLERKMVLALLGCIAIGAAGCQSTTNVEAMLEKKSNDTVIRADAFMPVGQQVVPPMGFISFCLNDPSQCEGGTDTPASMALTKDRWAELNAVNDYVNSAIPQVEDIANYGKSEVWSYPNENGGDCEDFALMKRKLLIERGWSPSDLLVAVVREWNGAGHAILVADTDKGEFVLDNKNWAIVAWNETPYTWVKRQSRERPYIWVNLDQRSFRTAANDTLPPLGAEIPFVAAANAKRLPAATQMAKAETPKTNANAVPMPTQKAENELRPSLAMDLPTAALDLKTEPTAALMASR